MNEQDSSNTPGSPTEQTPFRAIVTDAIRYWEPRRLLYNAALAVIVLGCFVAWLPTSSQLISITSILALTALAVLANVCYCAAYVVDVFVQHSGLRDSWRRYRWVLFCIGVCFASILTYFFSIGLIPPGDHPHR